jgi:hypothetical protein
MWSGATVLSLGKVLMAIAIWFNVKWWALTKPARSQLKVMLK